MDDILIASSNEATCIHHTDLVISALTKAGITINYEKSALCPTHKIRHIGFLFDTRSNRIILPTYKLRDIARSAQALISDPSHPKKACKNDRKTNQLVPSPLSDI